MSKHVEVLKVLLEDQNERMFTLEQSEAAGIHGAQQQQNEYLKGRAEKRISALTAAIEDMEAQKQKDKFIQGIVNGKYRGAEARRIGVQLFGVRVVKALQDNPPKEV